MLDLNTQPSLDLQFATGKTLDDRVSGNNLVTFSRASTGTYVGSDGLIKTSPVNLLTYSNLITSANWTFSRLSAPTSATTEIDSPVSGSSVFKLLETTDTGEHYFRKSSAVPIASSTTVTTSLYINTSLGRSKVRVYSFALNNLTFIWDLVNNAEISLTGGTSATVESTPIGNNWYRLKWTDIATANNDFKPSIMSVTDSNQFSFAGDTSRGFYITGYQIEEGTTATDYTPTGATKSGAPRFDHDPVTGESLGLLIEESRTNLLTYSEEFNQWSKVNGSSVTSNQSIAPDGTNSADLITFSNTPFSQVFRNISGSVSGTYTCTVYVKSSSGPINARLVFGADTLDFTSTDVWQRLQLTGSGSATQAFVITTPTDGGELLAWGAQVESGSFPTSYIPTTSSAVTRAADVASITGTNFSSWYNQSEGTVFIEDKVQALDSFPMAWVLQNTTNGTVSNYLNPSGNWVLDSRNNGADFDLSLANASGLFVKRASGLKNNALSYSLNGLITTVGTGNITSSASVLYIGQRPPSYSYNGHISRLTYYPYRLADAILQEITS